jgi:putative ABC transport system permease protein
MRMPIALRLAVRQWLARPLRPVLCSLAIAAAVALIICVGAAMDSLRYSVSEAIGQALGVAEVHVRPVQRGTDARVSQAMLDEIRARPEVEFAGGRLAGMGVLQKDGDHVFDAVGITEPLDQKLRPKNFAAGRTLSPMGQAREILVDTSIADFLSLHVGDEIPYHVQDNPPQLMKVVGIVRRPTLEFISQSTMYVPLESLANDLHTPGQYSVLDIKLKDSADINDYDAYAKSLGQALGPSVEVRPGTTSKANMAEMTRTLRFFLTIMSMLSGFCAALIIGTTLSVGVQERIRQFGQFRCIGAARGQLAAFVLGDALVMLAIGELLGGICGIALSVGLIRWFPSFFLAYKLSGPTLIIALCCGGFATMLGALIPIWQVTRVSPMAAVTAVARQVRKSRVWLAAAGGVTCLATQVLLWLMPVPRDTRLLTYAICGAPLVFGGWCLLAPACVIALEAGAATVLGVLFNVRASLLRHAWSRTPWRAGGMIAALMIGVALFTVVQARGQSVNASIVAPKIPDVVVKSLFSNFNPKRIERLQQSHPGIRDYAPFDYFTVRTKTGNSPLSRLFQDDRMNFIAVDPARFAALVEMDYVQGTPRTALKQLEDGRHIYVTTEFSQTRHLGVGDKLTFRAADGKDVEFTIAAVVRSTGVDMVKNFFDLRAAFGEQAINSVLGSAGDAKKYFDKGDPTLMLLNIDREKVKDMAAFRDKLEKDEGLKSLSSVEVKQSLHNIISRVVNGLSVIGIGALLVASLGVANMVIASIHARRFEFGVLRAIGAGRSQLVRLVLAEVTLIGIVAGILGGCAGLWFAFMATQVDRTAVGFAMHFLDPHASAAAVYAAYLMLLAIVLTTILGYLAAIIPAFRGATSAQQTLLASGRG